MDKPDVRRTARMHDMMLLGAQQALPTTAGTHLVEGGQLQQVLDSATLNPEPFTEKAAVSADGVDSTQSDPAIVNEIVAAIARVDTTDRSLWTKNQGPKLLALQALVGFDITEAERDTAWAQFNTGKS